MSSLKIFLWAINESREAMEDLCSHATISARIQGINVELLGIGHKFKGHKQRFGILFDRLRAMGNDDLVLCMDGADTLFNERNEAIVSQFLEKKTGILISAEKNFSHQNFSFKDKFDLSESPYKYVNAGTFMGYVRDLKEMLEEIFSLEALHPRENDQGLLGMWAYLNLEIRQKVQLDHTSNVFWVTARDAPNLKRASESGGTIYNPITNTKPSIIHVTTVNNSINRQNFNTAYETIVRSGDRDQFRIFVITPLIDDEKYFLSAEKKNDKDLTVPIWYTYKHVNISIFFYGHPVKMTESILATTNVHEAIFMLEKKYFVDYVVHVPKGFVLDSDQFVDYIKNDFKKEKVLSKLGSDSQISESFIYHKSKYYPYEGLRRPKSGSLEDVRKSVPKILRPDGRRVRRWLTRGQLNLAFDVISIGGWCGPAISLTELGIRKEAYPFCMIHSTLDCLIEVINGNYAAFFQDKKYTIMPHHKMDDPTEKEKMDRRLERFIVRLRDPKPIMFVRTIIDPDHRRAIKKLNLFYDILRVKYKRNDRFVVIMHDQKIGTCKIKMQSPYMMIWAAEGEVGWHVPNRENIQRNYNKIIASCLDPDQWKYDVPQIRSHEIISHKSKPICKELYKLR